MHPQGKVSHEGPTREQGPDPQTQKPQGSGTGGGGSGQAAPQPTAEAPKPDTGAGIGSHKSADAAGGGGGGSGGFASGLQPSGLKPTNEGLAGMGRLDTPGASTGPGAATTGRDGTGS